MKKLILIYGIALLAALAGCKSEDKPNEPIPTTVAPTTTTIPEAKGVWCLSGEGDFGPCLNAEWFAANPQCEVGQVTSGRNERGGCSKVYCKHSCNSVMNFFMELVN